jgi:putative ABC transport system substrate-binding protein
MRRREFITLLGGSAAAAWPLAARAQQLSMPVIGLLASESPDPTADRVRAFRKGLSETGYVEGRNVAIEYRWAEDQITGVSTLNVEVGPKRLQLLHEVVPAASAMAMLVNPTNPTLADALLKDARATTRPLGLQLHVLHARTEQDFDMVFASIAQLRAGVLVIGADTYFNSRIEQLAALTVRHAVPAIYQLRAFAAAGGLMSYGGDIADAYRLGGIYTGRILKGEKPADLPVQQSTKVELFINLKTAKMLGLTVPTPLLGRADEVIE